MINDISKRNTDSSLPWRSPSLPTGKPRFGVQDWWLILGLPLLVFLILPVMVIFWQISPAEIWFNLRKPQVFEAIRLSLLTSLCTVFLSMFLGTPLGYLLARKQFRFRRLADALIDLPIVLPPAVAGVALLMTFGRRGIIGQVFDLWGFQVAFTPVAVIIAQVFVAAPFYIKAATAGFASLDSDLEKAAALDGASSWQIFRHITIPLTWTALLGGSVMTWARALGEFGATIIFAGNYPGRTQTMPLAIYLGFELDLNIALTLSVILIGVSFLVLMAVKFFFHRDH